MNGGCVMSNKPDGRRVCTEEEIAEVLDGFKEEMLASIRRNRAEAEVVQFPPKLSEQGSFRREQVINQALERINEQRREQGLPSLETARQYRASLEIAPAPQGKVLSNHDPIKLFEDEIERENGDD
jgi:hypothetical protein